MKLVFDTYQKILAEAIEELKEKEFKDLYVNTQHEKKKFVKETSIDTDFELLFPDDYVNNITERLNLYNKLGTLENEEQLQKFEKELVDRFGEIPIQVVDLLNSVRIKWIAIAMGLERILMKKGKLVGYFIADQESGFYQSSAFTKVLQYAQSHSNIASMKEKQTRKGLRLIITFDHVKSVESALKAIEHFMV